MCHAQAWRFQDSMAWWHATLHMRPSATDANRKVCKTAKSGDSSELRHTCQDAGLAVDDVVEDSVELSLREAVEALRIAQEAVRVHHGVVHLDGEGDRHIKGHQVPGDAARTTDVSGMLERWLTSRSKRTGVSGAPCKVGVERQWTAVRAHNNGYEYSCYTLLMSPWSGDGVS